MDNANQTIHDFDFTLICNYFKQLERQGPGNPEMTLKALSFIRKPGPDGKVADLECGTGGQTRVLARNLDCRITGLDLFPGFVDIFNEKAIAEWFGDRVRAVVGSMDDLPFGNEELDIIWSEGAIYNMGFENGLRSWRRYLKPGGYVAVTESAWFTDTRPEEIERFWNEAYPLIDTIPTQVRQMQEAGYRPIAHFVLPDSCWTDEYYAPQGKTREEFLRLHPESRAAADFIASQRHEQMLYEKYSRYYGYVFYIGRKE